MFGCGIIAAILMAPSNWIYGVSANINRGRENAKKRDENERISELLLQFEVMGMREC